MVLSLLHNRSGNARDCSDTRTRAHGTPPPQSSRVKGGRRRGGEAGARPGAGGSRVPRAVSRLCVRPLRLSLGSSPRVSEDFFFSWSWSNLVVKPSCSLLQPEGSQGIRISVLRTKQRNITLHGRARGAAARFASGRDLRVRTRKPSRRSLPPGPPRRRAAPRAPHREPVPPRGGNLGRGKRESDGCPRGAGLLDRRPGRALRARQGYFPPSCSLSVPPSSLSLVRSLAPYTLNPKP